MAAEASIKHVLIVGNGASTILLFRRGQYRHGQIVHLLIELFERRHFRAQLPGNQLNLRAGYAGVMGQFR